MSKQKFLIVTCLVCLLALTGYGVQYAAESQKKKAPAAKPVAEQKKAAGIDATAKLSDTHPAIEEGITCNDCHEVKIDAKTTATQAWLYGDYMKWKAKEGIMPKDKVWEQIVKILGGKKQKRTFVLATSLNNKPLTTTIDCSLDPDKKVIYAFSERGTGKLDQMRVNPHVSLNWHKEFTDFQSTLCVQVSGKAELFDGTTKEFDEGLSVYYFEYGAEAQKIPAEKMMMMMKKGMIMTRITIDQITFTDNSLFGSEFRNRQRWTRN